MSTSNEACEVLRSVTDAIGDEAARSDFVSQATATRYLRAHGTVKKAVKSMIATVEYRNQIGADHFGMNKQTSEVYHREMVKRGLFLAELNDGDDPPSPILVMRKRKEAFDMDDFEEFRRFVFFSLDTTARIADLGVKGRDTRLADEQRGQWVVVMDMSNYKEGNSPPLSVTREVVRIFQNHFPERAKLVVIVDAPTAFWVLWRVIRLFMETVTRQKFVFVNREESRDLLVQRFGARVVDSFDVNMEEGKERSTQILVDFGMLHSVNPCPVDT